MICCMVCDSKLMCTCSFVMHTRPETSAMLPLLCVPAGFVIQVEGVAGHSVDLPCDISTHSADDQAVLVLWYKDDDGTPLYK